MGRALEARRGGGRGEAGCDVGIGMVVSVIYTFRTGACGLRHNRVACPVREPCVVFGVHARRPRGSGTRSPWCMEHGPKAVK
jgi:hypothetical protein